MRCKYERSASGGMSPSNSGSERSSGIEGPGDVGGVADGARIAMLPRMARASRDGLTYILPIKSAVPQTGEEMTAYVCWLTERAETIVVDGSPPAVFGAHAADLVTSMGKVGGVLTGLRLASHERIIIADDDVRYDDNTLARVASALDTAEVVRPQNYFSPLPWHARWDTGRMLLNRLTGGDWPGTLGVRRSVLRATGGYDGRALFENLELVRTVVAAGGREATLPGVYVLRRPSTT